MAARMEATDEWAFLERPRTAGSLGSLGRYDVRRLLGRGSFGAVFEAHDTAGKARVALKVSTVEAGGVEAARRACQAEARALAEVRHANVVRLIGVEEAPIPCVVMELLEGSTLDEVIRRDGALEPALVVALGRQIADGLAAVHARGLVHRDLKPANVVVSDDPAPQATLIDLGLAEVQEDAWRTPEGSLHGTPLYMAPEQAAGKTADYAADLFSLGAVLYHMLTGTPPFQAPTESGVITRLTWETPRSIRELVPAAPERLVAVIAKLLAKSPRARFCSAGEAARALTAAVDAPAASPPREPPLGMRILSRSEAVRPVTPLPPMAADLDATRWQHAVSAV
jgi:eukaryotic-like serine/threonine-protein kinase